MKHLTRLFVLFGAVAALVSCVRDDDEPSEFNRPISRLYISTSEYQVNTTLPRYNNLYVMDPADGDDFSTTSLSYTSGALGGNGILFSPDLQRILQASINNLNYPDTAVQVIGVNPENGQIGVQGGGGLVVSDLLTSIKGMAYHPDTDFLFLINSSANSNLFAYARPRQRRNPVKPDVSMAMGGQLPYAVFIRDLSLENNDKRNITYITTVGENGKILGYNNLPNNFLNRPVDSIRTDIVPNFTLSIPGTHNLVGVSYSEALDLLVAVDFNEGAGRILFFEGFSTNTSNQNLTPSKVIEGSNTLLKNPVDIEIDKREEAVYLYVADTQTKAVLRFRIEDEGNVTPNAVLRIEGGSRTPVGISLDARSTPSTD